MSYDPIVPTIPGWMNDVVDAANRVRYMADQVEYLEPPDNPAVDPADLVQAAMNTIGGGSGAIYLAKGTWNFHSGMTSAAKGLVLFTAGVDQMIINVDPGVDLLTLSNPNDWPHYEIGGLHVNGGRSAIRLEDPDPTHTNNLCANGCVFYGMKLKNQEVAAIDLNNALYASTIYDSLIEGNYVDIPTYGIYQRAYFGMHNVTLLNVRLRATGTAAVFDAGGLPWGISDLSFYGCQFESNAGQVMNLTGAKQVSIHKGWWENNCAVVQAEPVPLAEFTNCEEVEITSPRITPSGAGGKDPADGDRTTIVKTNNRVGHVFHANPHGYVKYGAQVIYADEPIHVDTRPQYVG